MFTIHSFLSSASDEWLPGLIELLRDSVDGGASIGFAAPLSLVTARQYWLDATAGLGRFENELLMACTPDGTVAGSVQLARCPKENGRHRAEVRKLMVRSAYRRKGLASRLMDRVEELARGWGITLLVLDTATREAAETLYERRGYARAGVIPGYASHPDGGLHPTTFFYKTLA